jgi:hypothetical protein
MLDSLIGFRVYINGLINLDLLRKGLYCIRFILTDDGKRINPYGCAAQPSRLQSSSRGQLVQDSELGSEMGSIDDDHYNTRSCFIRYVDEAFDLDEVVSFQFKANTSRKNAEVSLIIDLMRADFEISEEPVMAVNRKSFFTPVCTRVLKFPLRTIEAGLRPVFYPIVFDMNNLACVTLSVQSCLLHKTFVKEEVTLPDMKPFLERLCASYKHLHESSSRETRISNFMSTASSFATALASTALPLSIINIHTRTSFDEVNELLSVLRKNASKPQCLAEFLIPSYLEASAQFRLQAIAKVSSLLASAEKITELNSADFNEWLADATDASRQLLKTCVSEVKDISPDLFRLTDAEVQEAHFKLISPLLTSFTRLTAFDAYIKSLVDDYSHSHTSLPEARFSISVLQYAEKCFDGNSQSCFLEDEHKKMDSKLLLSACASRYAIDGRAVGSDNLTTTVTAHTTDDFSGISNVDFDAYGIHILKPMSFRSRTAAARKIEFIAQCLENEAISIHKIILERWLSTQRESLKFKCEVSLSLQAEYVARSRRHVKDASQISELVDATYLLESSLPTVTEHSRSVSQWALDPVTSSIPSSIQLHISKVKQSPQTPSAHLEPSKAHVVVFIHGLGGTIHDTRLLRAHLKLHHPGLVCYSISSVQGKDTENDILENGVKIAQEIGTFIREKLPEDGLTIGRLSFVSFSLGGLLARVAIRHSSLRSLVEEYGYAFISFSSPHLGVRYGSSLVSAGMFVIRQYKPSPALSQLMLLDSTDSRECLLYFLCEGSWDVDSIVQVEGDVCASRAALIRHNMSSESNGSLFSRFSHVCLLASHQDNYSPFDSCLSQFSRRALEDVVGGSSYCEMARSFYGISGGDKAINAGIERRFSKINVTFFSLEESSRLLSIEGIIGRDAHVSFLESEPLASAFSIGDEFRHLWV